MNENKKKIGLYQEDGYLNWEYIKGLGVPFIFMVGGRGTGKTYGKLKDSKENNTKFMYMRRTQEQVNIIKVDELSPFKKLNKDLGWNVTSRNISKYIGGFYDGEEIDGQIVVEGLPIGYSCALSTIANMRGFDASDVEELIYDEFIPEKHERHLKGEASALFNAYETINRNRELEGLPPLKLYCCSNSNDLGNPLFLELGLVKLAEKMREKGKEIHIDRKKGFALIIMEDSPISERKRKTALYCLTEGTEFAEMALDNAFSAEERGRIKSMPLKEYYPIVKVGEICVYKHKFREEFYISTHVTGSPPEYGSGDTDRTRFKKAYTWLWQEYMFNNIIFEEYLCEILFTKYYN